MHAVHSTSVDEQILANRHREACKATSRRQTAQTPQCLSWFGAHISPDRLISPPVCLPQLLPFFRSGTTPPGQMGVRPARAAIADRELQACPQHPAALHRRSKLPYLLLCKSRPAHPTASLASVEISDRQGGKHSEHHPPNHSKISANTLPVTPLLRTVQTKYDMCTVSAPQVCPSIRRCFPAQLLPPPGHARNFQAEPQPRDKI